MKLRFSKKRNQAMDIVDLLVIIAVIAIIAVMVVLIESGHHPSHAPRITCLNNLKEVDDSFRIWEEDNNNQYPMSVSVTNGGGMELIATGNVAGCLQVMSNELSTPIILICPADKSHIPATNFQNDFNNSRLSYFINPDASEAYPQQVMSGDDNLAINDVPIKPGLLELPTNTLVSFTADRHIHVGNIGFADGSVAEVSTIGLQSALALSTNGTPFRTNRLAIP